MWELRIATTKMVSQCVLWRLDEQTTRTVLDNGDHLVVDKPRGLNVHFPQADVYNARADSCYNGLRDFVDWHFRQQIEAVLQPRSVWSALVGDDGYRSVNTTSRRIEFGFENIMGGGIHPEMSHFNDRQLFEMEGPITSITLYGAEYIEGIQLRSNHSPWPEIVEVSTKPQHRAREGLYSTHVWKRR